MKQYKLLLDIQNYLIENPLDRSEMIGKYPSLRNWIIEGRIGSTNGEKILVEVLKDKFGDLIQTFREYSKSKKSSKECRAWYDIIIHDPAGPLPTNIKFSKCQQQDNCGTYAPLVWSLTNDDMDLSKNIKARESCEKLFSHVKKLLNQGRLAAFKPEREYAFLVIDKTNMSNVVVNGIRGLKKYYPNGSAGNRPFQGHWGFSDQYIERPYHETIKMIFSSLEESFKRDPEQPIKEAIALLIQETNGFNDIQGLAV